MDFRSLLQSLETLSEADVKHKGSYGTSYGKEDVRDQYGHRIGKVDKDKDSKKEQPKKGRGRPKKGSDDSGEVKKYDTKSLGDVFGGGKKPSKEVGKTSKKHSLKEYIEEVSSTKQLEEDNQFKTQPVPQQTKQLQMVMGPDGRPVLDQPVPTDTALRVANALNVSDVNEEEMDEGSIQGGVWTATPPKPGQPNVPAPTDPEGVPSASKPKSSPMKQDTQQPLGTIKGGVWTADPPKAGQKGVPAPVPVDEEAINEKAVSKAQQRFFGMVHAMQKGKKVPGASKELKDVAKSIGKSDAKDFAKTKHKGLPQHVKKTNEAGVGSNAYASPAGVTRQDPNRVQVAPNVQKSVVDYDKQVKQADQARTDRDRQQHPYWDQAGKAIGDVVGGAKSRWNALTGAASAAHDQQTGRDKFPDPAKPVDIIRNPRQGSANPRNPLLMPDAISSPAASRGMRQSIPTPTPTPTIPTPDIGRDVSSERGTYQPDSDMQEARVEPILTPLAQTKPKSIYYPDSKKPPVKKFDKPTNKFDNQDGKLDRVMYKPDQSSRPYELDEQEVDESGLQAYLGNKKYGKDGMDALRKAGREHASKEKMANIRAKYDKMDESVKTKVIESIITEGAMKELIINFHDEVHKHMGDGSVFDLKRANNLQQAEEVLKTLVKHSDEYNNLDHSNQNELVNQTLKYLAHEKELPFNTLTNVDKQRFAQRTPNDLSSYRQHPGATPGSDFSKPGSPMAIPRTTTGSNGFLKTLSTPSLKESNDMKDKQFESWEQQLNSYLNEGITISQSTGQQGSPDSVSINATEHDATELMSILRNSGMEMFGGSKETDSGYGAPEHTSDPEGHGVEPEMGPTVIGHGDDMLSLIKKMSGIETDKNTPASVEVDYEDEEGSGEEGHDEACDDCGQSPCSCDDEEGHDDKEEVSELRAEYPGGSTELPEGDMEEGNAFTGKLAQTKQGDSFKMGDKTYKDTSSIEEDEMEEGNKFTGNLAKARAAGKKEADLDGDGDMEKVREGEDTCNECGMYEGHCTCDHEAVEEGYANEAGGDAMAETELFKLKELLSRGNDLHREKHSQATGNIHKVTTETKLFKESTDLLVDYKKLSGIK